MYVHTAMMGTLLPLLIEVTRYLLKIRYPILTVTAPVQLIVITFVNVPKLLLVTTKSNKLRSGSITPLHLIIRGTIAGSMSVSMWCLSCH
jgi:hypothetical protein